MERVLGADCQKAEWQPRRPSYGAGEASKLGPNGPRTRKRRRKRMSELQGETGVSRSSEAGVHRANDRERSTETKSAFKTTELIVYQHVSQ